MVSSTAIYFVSSASIISERSHARVSSGLSNHIMSICFQMSHHFCVIKKSLRDSSGQRISDFI